MAALGWELDLGFAASDAGTVTPTVTSLSTLLLLGACLWMLVMFLG